MSNGGCATRAKVHLAYLSEELLAVEYAGLNVDRQVGVPGQQGDVDAQDLHPELPVAVPHGDGEHPLVVLLVDGELLMGPWVGTWVVVEHLMTNEMHTANITR